MAPHCSKRAKSDVYERRSARGAPSSGQPRPPQHTRGATTVALHSRTRSARVGSRRDRALASARGGSGRARRGCGLWPRRTTNQLGGEAEVEGSVLKRRTTRAHAHTLTRARSAVVRRCVASCGRAAGRGWGRGGKAARRCGRARIAYLRGRLVKIG
eukprot:6180147-Prymnesium_polylepis.1